MTFTRPNATAVFDNAAAQVSDDGHSADYLGHQVIKTAVDETVPAYDEVLDLGLETSAQERHERLGGLAFGKINKDVARLQALVLAIENISAVVKSGKEQLGQDWKGESYEAFRQQVEKIEKTLNDYSAALKTTADGLQAAMSGITAAYEKHHNDCLESYFSWDNLSPPNEWRRMSARDTDYLERNCSCGAGCEYNEDEHIAIIDKKLTTRHLFDDVLVSWDCMDDDALVVSQYNQIVEWAYQERGLIQDRVNAFCASADGVKTFVDEAYDAALENLRILSEVKVFSHLQLAGAPAGPGPAAGGEEVPSGGGPGATMPPPLPNPEPMPEPPAESVSPVAPEEPIELAEPTEPTEPAASALEETPATGERVEIKDGDRTIAVTSPDGQGHVQVTVANADGTTKTYDLDFDAASGLLPFGTPEPDGEPIADAADAAADTADVAEPVPAGTDGKCVIQDGPLTITAERPLFAPESIRFVVDDGTGDPTTYQVDFAEETPETPDEPATTEDETATPATGMVQPTSPQARLGDDVGERGAMSGQLSDDTTDPGEAGLASADDEDEPTSPSGLPMTSGAGSGLPELGRAAAGWSVHGDLFDSGEPVYSMHGVLGDDDGEQ